MPKKDLLVEDEAIIAMDTLTMLGSVVSIALGIARPRALEVRPSFIIINTMPRGLQRGLDIKAAGRMTGQQSG